MTIKKLERAHEETEDELPLGDRETAVQTARKKHVTFELSSTFWRQ